MITVLFDNQPVPQSPFIIVVDSTHNAAECNAYGPGLEKEGMRRRRFIYCVVFLSIMIRCYFTKLISSPGLEAGKPTYFTIDAKKAGKAKPSIAFTGPAADPHIIDNGVSYPFYI